VLPEEAVTVTGGARWAAEHRRCNVAARILKDSSELSTKLAATACVKNYVSFSSSS
jgi:hypothetical protein